MIYVVVHSHYEEHWNVAVFSDRALAEKYKSEQDDAHIDIEEFELDDGPDWKALAHELAEALETARDYMFIEEATPLDRIREDKDRRMVDDLLARSAGLLEGK